jgi:predicted aspartyl protease
MRKSGLPAALIGLLLGAVPAAAQIHCAAAPLSAVPLLAQSGRLMIAVKINDQPALFALDTGTATSVMSMKLIERLGLRTTSLGALGGWDIGGKRAARMVSSAKVTLGHHTSGRTWWRYLAADLSIDGLLGMDLLQDFDVDLDFAAGQMRLFAPGACDGVAPAAIAVAMMRENWPSRIRIPVRLDGRQYQAVVDTGASRSYFAASTARQEFGLDIAQMKPGRARGAYGGEISVAPHDFRALEIGGVTFSGPRLSLAAPDEGFDGAPILLGMEQLRHLRLFVSKNSRRLYVAPARQP